MFVFFWYCHGGGIGSPEHRASWVEGKCATMEPSIQVPVLKIALTSLSGQADKMVTIAFVQASPKS